jgi:hypothetical protein
MGLRDYHGLPWITTSTTWYLFVALHLLQQRMDGSWYYRGEGINLGCCGMVEYGPGQQWRKSHVLWTESQIVATNWHVLLISSSSSSLFWVHKPQKSFISRLFSSHLSSQCVFTLQQVGWRGQVDDYDCKNGRFEEKYLDKEMKDGDS